AARPAEQEVPQAAAHLEAALPQTRANGAAAAAADAPAAGRSPGRRRLRPLAAADAARDGALHRGARHARRARDLRELRKQVREAGRDRDLRRHSPRLARDPARARLVAPAGRRPLVALARPRRAALAPHPRTSPDASIRARREKGNGPGHRERSLLPGALGRAAVAWAPSPGS